MKPGRERVDTLYFKYLGMQHTFGARPSRAVYLRVVKQYQFQFAGAERSEAKQSMQNESIGRDIRKRKKFKHNRVLPIDSSLAQHYPRE
jgi:hypothetical protein